MKRLWWRTPYPYFVAWWVLSGVLIYLKNGW